MTVEFGKINYMMISIVTINVKTEVHVISVYLNLRKLIKTGEPVTEYQF